MEETFEIWSCIEISANDVKLYAIYVDYNTGRNNFMK